MTDQPLDRFASELAALRVAFHGVADELERMI